MNEMVPGLHENTRPQRKGRDGAWAVAPREAFEERDAPPGWVGLGLAGLLALLALSVFAIVWFAGAERPRAALLADAARARFRAAGPALEVEPWVDRVTLERAHPAPSGAALSTAMNAIVAQGWGESAPPSSRAETAMGKAETGQ